MPQSAAAAKPTTALPPGSTQAELFHDLRLGSITGRGGFAAARGSCALRLYVPRVEPSFSSELLSYLDRTNHIHFGAQQNLSCLLQACQHPTTFVQHATLAFTAEVPLYRYLIEACDIVATPSEADFVLAPLLVGTLIALGWTKPPGRGKWSLPWFNLLHDASWLGDSAKTLILNSVDVPHLHRQQRARQRADATWVHLGDTLHTKSQMSAAGGAGAAAGAAAQHFGNHLRNSITVPHRTSQWLPLGFPPRPRPAKSLLLYGNINVDKVIMGQRRRKMFADGLENASRSLNVVDRVRLSWIKVKPAICFTRAGQTGPWRRYCPRTGDEADLRTPTAAATAAMRSRFCLCPSGDILGFTARLFFSVIHECIPVVVDLWDRTLGARHGGQASPVLSFPFPLSIDWSRFVVQRAFDDGVAHSVLRHLVAMPEAEYESRLSYMRSIAHWLVYDGLAGAARGAEAALVRELEARVRKR